MKSVAVYSLKGGVGKTTLAVNLAWAAARQSARRTLLWDLDPQAAATFLLRAESRGSRNARAVFDRSQAPDRLIRPTELPQLFVLPADRSLRSLDRMFHEMDRKKRLAKLVASLAADFDRTILDCPPGLGETADQVLRAADLVLIPLIPSPLSQRALDEVIAHLDAKRIGAHVLPVYNMVDRRRALHKSALEAGHDWPIVPMASIFEKTAVERRPVGDTAPDSPAARAISALWQRVERQLAR